MYVCIKILLTRIERILTFKLFKLAVLHHLGGGVRAEVCHPFDEGSVVAGDAAQADSVYRYKNICNTFSKIRYTVIQCVEAHVY